MKKGLLILFLMMFQGVFFAANAKNLGYDTGRAFVGGELGFGGFGNVSIGVIAGYQHYFKEEWQFDGFRHGVRGFGTIDWTQYGNSWVSRSALFFQAGADWTIDFTPNERFVWGAFVGPSLGFVSVFNHASAFSFGLHAGGSLMIQEKHKFEAVLGYGFYIFGLRYAYMF